MEEEGSKRKVKEVEFRKRGGRARHSENVRGMGRIRVIAVRARIERIHNGVDHRVLCKFRRH